MHMHAGVRGVCVCVCVCAVIHHQKCVRMHLKLRKETRKNKGFTCMTLYLI